MQKVGIGFDVHRLVSGRPLVLGGVIIEHPVGLEGHSDADVLAHAVCDALLGAAALGDLGEHFPDDDPAWKDANSMDLLAKVHALLQQANWKVGNVDATIIAQQPRLAPYREQMRKNLANCLDMDVSDVMVKATTTEGLGVVGRDEGMAAQAIVMINDR